MNLAVWLLALVQPLLGRILVSLGFSVVTITGFTAAVAVVSLCIIIPMLHVTQQLQIVVFEKVYPCSDNCCVLLGQTGVA